MRIPFATQAYSSRSLPIAAQRCVNAYAEAQAQDAKTPVAVFASPGIHTHVTLGNGPIRGMLAMGDYLYVVSAGGLWRIAEDESTLLLGTGITGLGVVSMAGSGTEVVVVNGTNGYVYETSGGTFAQIADGDFNAANTVTFFDGYFVFDWAGTNKFFSSDFGDATSYDPLMFASADVQPDLVLGVINHHETLHIFGEESIELWFNAGAVDFPFQRYDATVIERGCGAASTIVKEDNALFFLGDDHVFYRLSGVTPVRVSTHALEQAWAGYDAVDDAFAFSVRHEGHKFVTITFPTGNATFVYDVATGLWHERATFDASGGMNRWRVNCTAHAFEKTFVGDGSSGRIGHVHSNVYTEFDDELGIHVVLSSPPIHQDRKRVFMSRFELDMETGVGLTTGQGNDPQVMLRWSDDGGRTFSGLQLWNSFGKLGEYSKRVRWMRLGSFRQRILEVQSTDPVRRVFIAAHADLSVGM